MSPDMQRFRGFGTTRPNAAAQQFAGSRRSSGPCPDAVQPTRMTQNRTSTGRFCCDALCVPVMERFGPQGREEKMGRKFIDCREFPSEMNCTLALSAENEDELLEAAVQHAITVHGHGDTPDLRTMIRTAMRDGTPPVKAPRRAA